MIRCSCFFVQRLPVYMNFYFIILTSLNQNISPVRRLEIKFHFNRISDINFHASLNLFSPNLSSWKSKTRQKKETREKKRKSRFSFIWIFLKLWINYFSIISCEQLERVWLCRKIPTLDVRRLNISIKFKLHEPT